MRRILALLALCLVFVALVASQDADYPDGVDADVAPADQADYATSVDIDTDIDTDADADADADAATDPYPSPALDVEKRRPTPPPTGITGCDKPQYYYDGWNDRYFCCPKETDFKIPGDNKYCKDIGLKVCCRRMSQGGGGKGVDTSSAINCGGNWVREEKGRDYPVGCVNLWLYHGDGAPSGR
jgi:hypothetical protein